MNVALVLAGGTGSRLGADIPKQYLMCGGRMVIDYCLEALDESAYIDSIWVVADVVWQDHIKRLESWQDMRFRERTGSYLYIMGLCQ